MTDTSVPSEPPAVPDQPQAAADQTPAAADMPPPTESVPEVPSTTGETVPGPPETEAPAAEPPKKPQLTVVKVAEKAKQQLRQITGLDVATVSAVEEHDGDWRAYVNMVELRRVPSTSDVLATYEATLDASGELTNYKRLRRFLRGQVND